MINILITSAGSTAAMNIIHALRTQKELSIRIVSVDSDRLASGFFFSDKHYVVNPIQDELYIRDLLNIVEEEKIQLIIPGFSQDYITLSLSRVLFTIHGVHLAIPSHQVIEICEDKVKQYQYFSQQCIPTPRLYTEAELQSREKIHFPIFIKPRFGRSSIDSYKIEDAFTLFFYKKRIQDPIIQDYIEGTEYTIDILSNLEGEMLVAIPRKRIQVKNGLAVKSSLEVNIELADYARKIVENLGVTGISNIQCIISANEIFFTELNCRVSAGGMPLVVAAGINMPLLLVQMHLKYPYNPIKDYNKDLTMVRYWSCLFIEKNGAIEKKYLLG